LLHIRTIFLPSTPIFDSEDFRHSLHFCLTSRAITCQKIVLSIVGRKRTVAVPH